MADTDATPTDVTAMVETVRRQLAVLWFFDIETTLPTDDATLAFQIAHVVDQDYIDAERLVLLLHAFQQLAGLAQANVRAWKALVRELWQDAARELLVAHERATDAGGRCVVGLGVKVFCLEHMGTLCDAIATATTTATTTLPSLRPVPVELRMHSAASDFRGTFAFAVSFLVTSAFTQPRLVSVQRVRLENCQVDDVRGLAQLAKLDPHGLGLSGFPQLAFDVTTRNAASLVRHLQRLLATHRGGHDHDNHDHEGRATGYSIGQDVAFSPRPGNLAGHALRALISAVGVSAVVRTVEFGYDFNENIGEDAVSLTRWLAFALFSREARHSIRRFSLEGSVGRALSVQTIQDVLQADDPVAAVFPQLADSFAQHAHVRLSADRFVLFDPEEEESGNGAAAQNVDEWELTSHPHAELRILSWSPAWWSVVLPAWGRAWVRHADATVTSVDPALESRLRPRHQIPEVRISVPTTAEMAQSLSWLAFVGSGVVDAELCGSDGELTWPTAVSVDWTAAHAAFPRATTLRLVEVHVASLGAFAERIVAGHWRLEHLRFVNLIPNEAGVGVDAFLDGLASASQVTTTRTTALQSLTIVVTEGVNDAAMLAAALRLLATDRQLQRLCLTVWPSDSMVHDNAIKAAFAAYHGQPLTTFLREKLALLSVASPANGSLWEGIDRLILAELFRFAGF